jgi:hypothetical protein
MSCYANDHHAQDIAAENASRNGEKGWVAFVVQRLPNICRQFFT